MDQTYAWTWDILRAAIVATCTETIEIVCVCVCVCVAKVMRSALRPDMRLRRSDGPRQGPRHRHRIMLAM